MPEEEKLTNLRKKIDENDTEILELINKRANLAKEIGKLKEKEVKYRPERESNILIRLQEQNSGPIKDIRPIFKEIISQCRALEGILTVSFLGPEGTFSEEAAFKHFGDAIEPKPCGSIETVFYQVESGATDYGVVPVENSSEGAVSKTMDLLLQASSQNPQEIKICGEILLPIHQFLMAQDADYKCINKVYSHSQSLAQCNQWLKTHLPELPISAYISTSSNAEAARQATKDKNAAAIASKKAAEIFKLAICAENIEDNHKNTTRFLILGRQDVNPSKGKDKTSLIMSTNNESGAIYRLLEPLADQNVSMTRLESRPSLTDQWQYVFFVDIEGHQEDTNISTALDKLRSKATFLKILGSYPAMNQY